MVSIFLLSCTQKEKRCIITGTVINRPQSEFILLVKAFDALRSPDVVKIPIQDGKFTYEFSYSEVEAYNLVFDDEHSNGSWFSNYFFPTNGKVIALLHDKGTEIKNIITGGKENQKYNAYKENINAKIFQLSDYSNAKFDSLISIGKYESDTVKTIRKLIADCQEQSGEKRELLKQISTLRRENLHLTHEAKVVSDDINEQLKKINSDKLDYIDKNPSIAAYFMLIECCKMSSELFDATLLKRLTEKYTHKYKTHPYTQQFLQTPFAVGEKYFDFTLKDINGTSYKLSDKINGKYAVIDIWAPWCGSCLTRSRALKSLYNDFSRNDFEIIGVSSKYYKVEDVEKVLRKENYPWLTLIDSDDWKSDINIQYNIVNAGGVTILVNKKGIVLAINPTIDYIKSTLKEEI